MKGWNANLLRSAAGIIIRFLLACILSLDKAAIPEKRLWIETYLFLQLITLIREKLKENTRLTQKQNLSGLSLFPVKSFRPANFQNPGKWVKSQ